MSYFYLQHCLRTQFLFTWTDAIGNYSPAFPKGESSFTMMANNVLKQKRSSSKDIKKIRIKMIISEHTPARKLEFKGVLGR